MLNVKSNILRPVLVGVCIACTAGVMLSASAADTLVVNQVMKRSQHLESANGEYRLEFQPDGNVVIRRKSDQAVTWSSKSENSSADRLVLGPNGNLSVRGWGRSPAWESGTRNSRVSRMTLQNDGNLVMFDTMNEQIWETGTQKAGDVSALATNVTFVSASSAFLKSSTSTMSIARPTSVSAGDVLYLAVVVGPNGGLVPTSAGSGWTLIKRCTVNTNTDTTCSTNGDDLGIALYKRTAAASDPANFTINKAPNYTTLAAIIAMRGAASNSAVSTFFDNGSGTLEFKTTCKGFTGTAGSQNVCIMAHDDSQPFLTPTNWTRRRQVFSDDSGLLIFTRSGATTVGDTTFNYDGDASTDLGNAINFSIQIRP